MQTVNEFISLLCLIQQWNKIGTLLAGLEMDNQIQKN